MFEEFIDKNPHFSLLAIHGIPPHSPIIAKNYNNEKEIEVNLMFVKR